MTDTGAKGLQPKGDDINGTGDLLYNIIWFIQETMTHSRRLKGFVKDAKEANNRDLETFFKDARRATKAARRDALGKLTTMLLVSAGPVRHQGEREAAGS
jgi:hypothetical protein